MECSFIVLVKPIYRAKQNIPGPHVKNLFLRDRKKKSYILITVLENKKVDLKLLGDSLELGRLSFASDNDLQEMLSVAPGSLTPLAIVNHQLHQVKFFLDSDLRTEENISIHPMENTATIHLRLIDLLAFIKRHRQNDIQFIDIPLNPI